MSELMHQKSTQLTDEEIAELHELRQILTLTKTIDNNLKKCDQLLVSTVDNFNVQENPTLADQMTKTTENLRHILELFGQL